MDFARRLAPPSDADTSRAVPVLPSRFEAGAPSLEPFASELSVEEVAPGDAPPLGPWPLRVAAPPAAQHSNELRRDDPSPQHGLRPRDEAAAVAGPRAEAPEPPRLERLSVVAVPARSVQPAGRDAPEVAVPTRAPVVAVPPRADAPWPLSAAAVARSPQAAAPSRRPVSQAALESRGAPTSEPPSVVHVTIDRIEVRAPATPTAPQALRARPTTPGVSLGDYLRQRGSTPGGAR